MDLSDAAKVTIKQPRLLRDNFNPNLKKYKRLKVSGPDLADPPELLFELTKLEFLDLSPERESCLRYKLLEVPRAISRLENLSVLCLGTNELRDIPAELCGLVKLETLILSNNLLTALPKELRQLQRLRSLHLANNFFDEVPRTVFYLRNLEFLDASDNKIVHLPRDVGNLVKLRTLLLYFNRLVTLPEELGHCLNLQTVWIGMNNLTSLPRCFGRLERLDWQECPMSSNVDGNPLHTPPVDVCKQGAKAMAEFFESIPKVAIFTGGSRAREAVKRLEASHTDDELLLAVSSSDEFGSSGSSWSVGSSQSFPGRKPPGHGRAPPGKRGARSKHDDFQN